LKIFFSSPLRTPRSTENHPRTSSPAISADELARLAEIYDVGVAWLLGEAPDTLDAQDPRLELAARELTKLKPDDLDRLLKLLAAMRNDSTPNAGGGDR